MFSSCAACGSTPAEHPQDHLVAGGLSACVDRALAPLLRTCWELGLLTYASCEDYLWSGRALLEFLTADAAQDFLSRVLDGADVALRRRVLEGGEDDGWSVQASLRELRVEGVQPVLRLGLQVLLPCEDVPLAAAAILAPRRNGPVEVEEHDELDDLTLTQVALRALVDDDEAAWLYLVDGLEDIALAQLLDHLGRAGLGLPYRHDVPPAAHLALSALCRGHQEAPSWEHSDADSFRRWAQHTLRWWGRAVERWPRLEAIEEHSSAAEWVGVLDRSAAPRLALVRCDGHVQDSMTTGAVDDVLTDLWFLPRQAADVLTALAQLEAEGCFPLGDPRSPVHRRRALDSVLHGFHELLGSDPVARRRHRLLGTAWTRAAAVTHLADGRHVVLRDLDRGEDGPPTVVPEGTREQYADLAHDALALPPSLHVWACRMVLGAGRKPARVEFLECSGSWEQVAAGELGAGDVLRMPGSRYAWQVADVHDGDGPHEVQLELAAQGLPVFGREDLVERWAPEDEPS